jgi:HSP20 family protein
MLGYFSDFDRTFAAMEELRRRVERTLSGNEGNADAFATDTGWPRTSVYDTGQALQVVADVPGLREKDVEVSLDNDVLTLQGERRTDLPEGYQVHRQERRPARFSRSFTLPFKVNVDQLSAQLQDGILTITLPKAPEAQPRKIAVRAG